MFAAFFKKELSRGLKSPMLYIFMFIVGLLVFGAVVSDNVIIGGTVGDVFKNAPSVVATYVTILNIFGLLFATAFFNNAALRDYRFNFNEIMFSTPISKAGYYFGRFCGAWVLSTFVMLGIYLAFMVGAAVGPAMGWIGADRMGPTPWGAFISTYFIFVVPNMFLAGTIIFALATRFKSTIVSFIGTLIIIITYIIGLNMASDLDSQSTAAIIDIFGISTYSLDTQYLTPFEKNTVNPSLSGYLLPNRILWSCVGIILLLFGYFTYSFATKAKKVKKQKVEADAVSSTKNLVAPNLTNAQDAPSSWDSFKTFFKINFLSILKSQVFIILLLFSIILLVSNLWNSFDFYGLQSYPVTYKMLDEINGISTLFVIIILVFFSGELVWRDRDSHLNEVIDSTPHHSVSSLLAKAISLIFLASLLHLALIIIGVLYQAALGYTNFELGLYFTDFLTGSLIFFSIFAGILIFIQVLFNNKYLGYFVSVLVLFLIDFIFLALKIESKMFIIGDTPKTMYSDMNGFGPGMSGHLWFSGYWILLGGFLILLAGLFWPRGTSKGLLERWKAGRKSLDKSYYGTLGFFSVAWLAVAGIVFYNTQILNPYDNSKTAEQKQVSYEKAFKKHQDAPKLSITDAVYNIDIFPATRKTDVVVDLRLKNKTNSIIDSLHFTINPDLNHELVIPESELVFTGPEKSYLIYHLKNSILPGDSTSFKVKANYAAKGFENSVSNTNVIRNGTFFNNMGVLPDFGYSEGNEISDKNKRKSYDLPERARMPELQTTCNHLCMKNYLTDGAADWVNVETYISTSEDQIAVAPGSLISEKTENGRRKYHYRSDHISQNFYSFISADYEVAKRKWNGIDLEVYYHAGHEVNVERMLDAVQKSLEYYTKHFGPYYHKQARIIEFPRYQNFAQAFPGTMPYSESFGFIINLEDEKDINVIDAVIAHEMAHQYWAHQVIGAQMQGSTMLSESFSEYSSLMVMKQTSDDLKMKDFLRHDLRRYLRGRSSETEKEVPLYKVENQGHIHYGKGAFVLYALQNYVGEEQVNTAMRQFLEEYRYQEPPYPTANDFMRYLEPQVPDSLQYLITDWFKEITLYDLRLMDSKMEKMENGQYKVLLEIIAKKTKTDDIGKPTEVPIKDWVDIGFYKDRDEEALLFRERIFFDQENMKLEFTLDTLPARAAIDPLRLLIDRIYDDNTKNLSL